MTPDTADRDDLAMVAALPLARPFLCYVAGASAEIARAERVIRLLLESGLAVSFDWPAHMRSLEGQPLTREIAVSSALSDIDAVKRASVVVLLEPGWTAHYTGSRSSRASEYEQRRTVTTGAWGEATLAVGIGTPLVVARPALIDDAPPEWQTCIFTALASLVCADDDAAIRAVVRMAITGTLPSGGAS